jgi:lipooligosaccharide transport system ATP-binding protein
MEAGVRGAGAFERRVRYERALTPSRRREVESVEGPQISAGPARGPVIRVRGLVKKFATLVAVDGISFEVHAGETYGLLGPNGAGKTSTMRMLSALSPPTAGEVIVAGHDVSRAGREVRHVLGVVTQADGLDTEVTVRQNLQLYGYLAGLSWQRAAERTSEVLRFFDLTERAEAEVDDLSGGMRRRLAIARALMTEPRVIILDEPTTGLDPQSRNRVWEELAVLKSMDVTVVMSTHYMEEAATLCDRVAIMDGGRILDEGTPAALIERHAGHAVAEARLEGASRGDLRARLDASGYPYREIGAVFLVTDPNGRPPDLGGIAGIRVSHRVPTLEDVFLTLTGKELRE